jgi:hypothetical protein
VLSDCNARTCNVQQQLPQEYEVQDLTHSKYQLLVSVSPGCIFVVILVYITTSPGVVSDHPGFCLPSKNKAGMHI